MHEGRLLHEGSNMHEDAFARRKFCTASILHEGSLLHGLKFFINFN